MESGEIALFWESGALAKQEKLEFGKEYPAYPAEVQEMVAHSLGWGYYTDMSANEPFVILTVTDYDLEYEWQWVYQVVDDWQVPDGSSVEASTTGTTTNSDTGTWASNDKGWWIQYADGSYLTNAWYQSPSSGLWYYMGVDGYMLTNTVTPDGYTVNADGAWVP